MTRTWFITGASSGFGRALAEEVIKSGDRVVVGARRASLLEEIYEKYGSDKALHVVLDVTDAVSRKAAVSKALSTFGRIDVLVNNAGGSSYGAVEEFTEEELRQQLELNFFAPAALTKEILPLMRAQGSGHILNVTSIAGLVAVKGCGPYSSAKFALEGWTEALAGEVSQFGIKVILIEPGAFATEVWGSSIMAENHIAAYDATLRPVREWIEHTKHNGDSAKAMRVAVEAVNAGDSAPLRLVLGSDAFELYESTIEARTKDIMSWRTKGEDTKFDK